MQEQENKRLRRTLASWRMRACCAGLCAGAQVYLMGAGVIAPVCGNSAWLASLAAVPSCALAAALCRRWRARRRMTRTGAALLAAALFCLSVFACASLAAIAGQALLPRTQGARVAVISAAFVLGCAACGAGLARLCFLVRAALPAVMILCAVLAAPDRTLSGIFPLLGRGALPLGVSALMMAASCVPVLLLLLPPPEIEAHEEAMPQARFFACRAAAGAGAGCALLFLFCAGGTPQAISGAAEWGERLVMLSGSGAHQGLSDTALLIAMTSAAALYAACMLAAGQEALAAARPGAGCAGLAVQGVLLIAVLLAFSVHGPDAAMAAAPLSALPAAGALIFGHRKKEGAR